MAAAKLPPSCPSGDTLASEHYIQGKDGVTKACLDGQQGSRASRKRRRDDRSSVSITGGSSADAKRVCGADASVAATALTPGGVQRRSSRLQQRMERDQLRAQLRDFRARMSGPGGTSRNRAAAGVSAAAWLATQALIRKRGDPPAARSQQEAASGGRELTLNGAEHCPKPLYSAS